MHRLKPACFSPTPGRLSIKHRLQSHGSGKLVNGTAEEQPHYRKLRDSIALVRPEVEALGTLAYPAQITVAVTLRVTLPLVAVTTQATIVPPAFAPLQLPVGDVEIAFGIDTSILPGAEIQFKKDSVSRSIRPDI